MKRIFLLLVMVSVLITSCGEEKAGKGEKENAMTEVKEEDAENKESEKHLSENYYVNDYIKVQPENGSAKIAFNIEKFLTGGGDRANFSEFLPIENLEGEIKNVVIGEITDLIVRGEYIDGNTQVVVFLMEDGSLKSLVISKELIKEFEKEDSKIALKAKEVPWIEDIEEIVQHFEEEGVGDTLSIFAKDKEGVRHNLKYALNSRFLLNDTWLCMLREEENFGLFFEFDEDGNAKLFDGYVSSDQTTRYEGKYNINTENGTMDLDLNLVYNDSGMEMPEKIKGGYFIEYVDEEIPGFNLWIENGDKLTEYEGNFAEGYKFKSLDDFLNYDMEDKGFSNISDDELMDYLAVNIQDIKNLINDGLSILITGDTEEINGETCRYVALGTDNSEHFVKERHYYVSPKGVVYEYDVVGDAYNIIYQ